VVPRFPRHGAAIDVADLQHFMLTMTLASSQSVDVTRTLRSISRLMIKVTPSVVPSGSKTFFHDVGTASEINLL
jgi:hypothetical protein